MSAMTDQAVKELKEMFPNLSDELLKMVIMMSAGSKERAIETLLGLAQGGGAVDEEDEEEEPDAPIVPGRSELEWYGEGKPHECGYCKSNGSVSTGATARNLTVQDYQDMIDRGWRRSGTYCYKPTMRTTCCPAYTIRLDVTKFKMSKSQKQKHKKTERYLETGVMPEKKEKEKKEKSGDVVKVAPVATAPAAPPQQKKEKPPAQALTPETDEVVRLILSALKSAFADRKDLLDLIQNAHANSTRFFDVIPQKSASARETRGDFSSNVAMRLVSLVKTGVKDPKAYADQLLPALQAALSSSTSTIRFAKVTASDNGFLNFFLANPPVAEQKDELKLSAETAAPKKTPAAAPSVSSTASVVPVPQQKKAKKVEKEDKDVKKDLLSAIPKQMAHKLEITIVRSRYEDEAFEVYKKYQIIIHKDEEDKPTPKSYKRFLVNSPLEFVAPTAEQTKLGFPGYGSFHQQYRLDGRLICVGVIDILPKCLSSVYLYYDPAFKFLSLGKYSAVTEIDWVQKVGIKASPLLKYYYLGFYIHSCPKMRYKAQYTPSDLCCPETLQWVPYTDAAPLLDRSKYSRLAPTAVPTVQLPPPDLINQITIILLPSGNAVKLTGLNARGQNILRDRLRDYVTKLGPELALRVPMAVH